jgi:RimJ/RimL family protein N-acetyltransferase
MATSIASGSRIVLRRASAQDFSRAFAWQVQSDLTSQWMGPPWFVERAIPDQRAFAKAYPAHYFDGSRMFDGRALLIRVAALDIGVLVWHRIDLLRDLVELEVWLASSDYARKGIASEAIQLACAWLQQNAGVNRFLLRPSRRNLRALGCARRAGFRETDLPSAQAQARLGLSASAYRDAVLLFRLLPEMPFRSEAPDGQLRVYLDTEFSSLHEPELLSVGAVCSDGRSFYAEIAASPMPSCSSFVEATVLPLMEGCGQSKVRAAQDLESWLRECAGGRAVEIVSDSAYDRWALADLWASEDLPEKTFWSKAPVSYADLDRLCADLRLRRHHALDDALALRRAVQGISENSIR